MIRYEPYEELKELAEEVIEEYSLKHIDLNRVLFFRSFGSKSKAIARCWALPRLWQQALGIEAHYVVEVIWERFGKLDEKGRKRVILHELLHIPKSFSGGLRNHHVLRRVLNELQKGGGR